MTMDRHEPFEELISASLAGDLTADERHRLDAHLQGCSTCRSTLEAFADQRRIMAGLRHVAPPRDLGARVRTGIETGRFAALPWWRRPAAIFVGVGGGLAAIAGALLAIVLLNSTPSNQVGEPTTTPSPSAEASPSAAPPAATPLVSSPPLESPDPSAAATPTPTPHPTPPGSIGWGAINYIQSEGTLADRSVTLRGWDPATQESAHLINLDAPDVSGEPVGAVFSPDSQWLAYQVPIGGKGTNQVVAVHLPSGRDFVLGETPDGSAFSQRMTWSPDSGRLAYTAADVDAGVGPDAWIFDAATEFHSQLTNGENTYVASFTPDGELLVSRAGERPLTYRITDDELESRDLRAPEDSDPLSDIFQPILSPDGHYAIFWRGGMVETDGSWRIEQGGMLYLSGEPVEDQPSWSGEQLFPTLPIDRDALGSASVAWSYDSDAFAVWDVAWRGAPQEVDGTGFPTDTDVYIGSALERDLIDEPGLRFVDPESIHRVVDVAFVGYDFGGETPAVAVTIFEEPPGETGESPVARSSLVIAPAAGGDGALPEIGAGIAWVGPALYVPQGGE
ncbi:MAG: zf-HC2 domain-containing protein [Candidatus Limnocylindria bacterium]